MYYLQLTVLLCAVWWSETKVYESQQQLVEALYRRGLIESEEIRNLLLKVDRKYYLPVNNSSPYDTFPVSIGYRASFSSLQMQAFMLEKLKHTFDDGNRLLDVGCGTGYLTVCMAMMVGKTGYAVGIEHIPQLYKNASTLYKKDKPQLKKYYRLRFLEGDGRKIIKDETSDGPFNGIAVGAAVRDFDDLPIDLLENLVVGGRLIAPVYSNIKKITEFQEFLIMDRTIDLTWIRSRAKALFIAEANELLMHKDEQYTEKDDYYQAFDEVYD